MNIKRFLKNKKGIVLVTVLSVTTVLMILVIGIVSTNVSQITSGQRQIDRIKYEALNNAASLQAFDNVYRTGAAMTVSLNPTLDYHGYPVLANTGVAGSGPFGSTSRVITSSNTTPY